jgi:hypothetical protein
VTPDDTGADEVTAAEVTPNYAAGVPDEAPAGTSEAASTMSG